MIKIITAEFRHKANAEEAIAKIRQTGNDVGAISLVTLAHLSTEREAMHITDGSVSTGSTIGGIAGLAIGFSTIAIPSLGVFAAAGPLAGLLSGTVLGGVAGSLFSPSSKSEENTPSEVLGGKVLFSMPVTQEAAGAVSKILKAHNGKLVELHREG